MEGNQVQTFKPLIGTDDVSVDEKGRVLLSKKKRERLGDNFACIQGAAGCIIVYPEARWHEVLKEVVSTKGYDPAREEFSRLFLGGADDELSTDSQGRFLIPVKLRDRAKIKDRVLIIGMGDHLEIWAKAEWEKYDDLPEAYAGERRAQFQRAYDKIRGVTEEVPQV